jgi:hypothetical protein
MAIIDYEVGIPELKGMICKDTNVYGANIYFEGMNIGQGCNTIWYDSVPACRAMLRIMNKVPEGHHTELCHKCKCHYSVSDPNYRNYKDYACVRYKDRICTQANVIIKKYPELGKKRISNKRLKQILERIKNDFSF